jgi:hypothetical protein
LPDEEPRPSKVQFPQPLLQIHDAKFPWCLSLLFLVRSDGFF